MSPKQLKGANKVNNSYLLDFPVTEYETRFDRLVSEMNENNIDAVILTTKENTRYFTGYQIIVWDSGISKPAVAIVTKDREITMISGYSNRGMLEASTWVKDFRIWDPLGRDGAITNLPECIFSVLEEKGLTKGNIGMEIGTGFRLHLNNSDYNKLMGYLNNATIKDAAPLIWNIRSIKSSLEIEKIKHVCDINIKAYDKAMDSIYAGMSEKELFQNIAKYMFEFGAEEVFPLGIRAGSDRYEDANSPPSARPFADRKSVV